MEVFERLNGLGPHHRCYMAAAAGQTGWEQGLDLPDGPGGSRGHRDWQWDEGRRWSRDDGGRNSYGDFHSHASGPGADGYSYGTDDDDGARRRRASRQRYNERLRERLRRADSHLGCFFNT